MKKYIYEYIFYKMRTGQYVSSIKFSKRGCIITIHKNQPKIIKTGLHNITVSQPRDPDDEIPRFEETTFYFKDGSKYHVLRKINRGKNI